MKVLFVSEGLDTNSIIAQPWRHIYDTAKELITQHHEVAVATDSPPTKIRREMKVRDVPAYVLPKTHLPPAMSPRMSPSEVRNLVKEFSPDIVYWDGGALIGNYIRRVKSINKPIAVHITTNLYTMRDFRFPVKEYRSFDRTFLIYAFTMSSPLARPLVRLLNQKNIRIITVPNKAIKERLTKAGISEGRIKTLPIPFHKERTLLVNSAQDFAKTREKLSLSTNDFVVAYFGPPQIYRGTDTLLYAAAKLKQKLPQLKLVMLLRSTGDSESTPERFLRKIASSLQLNENVRFVSGCLRREEMIEMIKTFDIIALPFKFLLNEPPLTALEAMALGKTLITTRVSGLPELVGDDRGFLVGAGNESELAHAIHLISMNPKEASERGRKAREYVSKLPEWNDYAKHVLKLFEGVLN